LEAFLAFASDNFDKPQYKGTLPPVLFMPEEHAFVVCA
jgi:hypothetical protein